MDDDSGVPNAKSPAQGEPRQSPETPRLRFSKRDCAVSGYPYVIPFVVHGIGVVVVIVALYAWLLVGMLGQMVERPPRETRTVREAILGHWVARGNLGYVDYYMDADRCCRVTERSETAFTYVVLTSSDAEKWIELRLAAEGRPDLIWHIQVFSDGLRLRVSQTVGEEQIGSAPFRYEDDERRPPPTPESARS